MVNLKHGLHKNKTALFLKLCTQYLCMESCVENAAFNARLRKILTNFAENNDKRVECFDRYDSEI